MVEFDIMLRKDCFKEKYYNDEECGNCYRVKKCLEQEFNLLDKTWKESLEEMEI